MIKRNFFERHLICKILLNTKRKNYLKKKNKRELLKSGNDSQGTLFKNPNIKTKLDGKTKNSWTTFSASLDTKVT